MSDIYKLQYNGMTLAYPGWNGYMSYEDVPKFKTLTLYASEGGTVTASVLTGMPGDTAQITTAYNTYYRFSGYDTAGGGSLNGNVYTFGDTDADISAVYKVNYFTATGGWEKGSNYQLPHKKNVTGSVVRYATASYKTDNVPADWYATSNRWNPNNASAYSFTGNPSVTFWLQGGTDRMAFNFGYVTAQWKVGSTVNVQSAFNATRKKGQFTTLYTYKPSYTTTTQNNTQYLSALMKRDGTYGDVTALLFYYSASLTTGTWTATGIAP